jgi:hypothetical protein
MYIRESPSSPVGTALGVEWVLRNRCSPVANLNNPSPTLQKKRLSYPPITSALNPSNWSTSHSETKDGGSPFRGLARFASRQIQYPPMIGLLGE